MISRLHIKLIPSIAVQTRKDVQSWLIGRFLSSDIFEDAQQKRTDSTCDWMLTRPEYVSWLSSDFEKSKTLWIHGPAGFGKTVLCSRLVQHVQDSIATPTAYFFFSANLESRNDPFVALRFWLSQIVSSNDSAFRLASGRLGKVISQGDQSQLASHSTLKGLISDITRAIPGCTLIIDGLDECTDSIHDFLMTVINALAQSQARLLIVSRDNIEIREALGDSHLQILYTEYKVSQEDTQEDVEAYSRAIVDYRLPNKTQDLRHDISQAMAEKCKGQFLWLKLQADHLRRGMNKRQLENVVNDTPAGVDRIYQRNWDKIMEFPDREKQRTVSLLRWAVFAFRPLTVGEITEAVLIDLKRDEVPIDLNELPDSIDQDFVDSEIVGLCGSLLEVRTDMVGQDLTVSSKTVHLTHFTVKQFLLINITTHIPKGLKEVSEHALLTKLCLHFINYTLALPKDDSTIASPGTATSLQFSEYATKFSHCHYLQTTGLDAETDALFESFFDQSNPVWDAWTQYMSLSTGVPLEALQEERARGPAGPLFYASGFGLINIVKTLIRKGHDVNEATCLNRTPLGNACYMGSHSTIKALLSAGADPNRVHYQDMSPIMTATHKGHLDNVKVLLEYGADITYTDPNGRSPLIIACINGREEIALLLMDKGADIASADANGWTVLHRAVRSSSERLVQQLVDRGADVTLAGKGQIYPIHLACDREDDSVVKLLIDKGVDVNVVNSMGKYPIHMAVGWGLEGMVRLLLDAGVDTSKVDFNGWEPIHYSCVSGQENIARLLIEKGVNINVADTNGFLHIACQFGFESIVQMLVASGADTNKADKEGNFPIHYASFKGYSTSIQLLIDGGGRGLDLPESRNRAGATALHFAAAFCQLETAKLLLSLGANSSSVDDEKCTALHYAAIGGDMDVVTLLLAENTALLSNRDSGGFTCLHNAISKGNLELTKFFLARGADILTTSYYGTTALHMAANNGHGEIVKLLLSEGIDVSAVDEQGRSALHTTAYFGHEETTRLLMSAGADISNIDHQGWTILHRTVKANRIEVAKLLLNAGADVSAITHGGWTVLSLGSQKGSADMVELLLDHGADIYAVSSIEGCQQSTALHVASRGENFGVIKALVAKGANLEARDEYGLTALHIAVEAGHELIAEFLVSEGADLEANDEQGCTALLIAVIMEKENTAELLISKGADLEAKMEHGYTALHVTAANGYEPMAKLLVTGGADLEARDDEGAPALLVAVTCGHETMVELFISNGADLEAKDTSGCTALFRAVANGFRQIAELLISKGADTSGTLDDFPLLHIAAMNGHRDVVDMIFTQLNVRPDLRGGPFGTSALHEAEGNPEMIRCLLKHVAHIDFPTSRGLTSLTRLAAVGDAEAGRVLADHGADVEASAFSGLSLLLCAASEGHLAVMQVLIEKGVRVERRNPSGMTALHAACAGGHVEIIKYLIESLGVDTSVRDNGGRSAFVHAAMMGQHEAVDYLCHRAAVDFTAEDWHGNSALTTAVANGHVKVVEALLQSHDSWVDPGSDRANTLLLKARRSGNAEVVKLIVDHLRRHDPSLDQDYSLLDAEPLYRERGRGVLAMCRVL